MKKYITHIALVLLCITNITLLADSNSCGPINFDLSREYPYKVCLNGVIFTKCLTIDDIAEASCCILKAPALPICYEFFGNYWQELPFCDRAGIVKDLKTAADKWNCICGYDTPTDTNECGMRIPVGYTSDGHVFRNPYNEPATALRGYRDHCNPINTSTAIYLNISSQFREGIPLPVNSNQDTIFRNSLANNIHIEDSLNFEYIMQLKSSTAPERLYNVTDVLIRCMGEILGIGYFEECGCGENNIMSPGMPKAITVADGYPGGFIGLGGADNTYTPEDDCIRSAFKALYCPTLSITADNQTEQKTFPNPAQRAVNITFTLPNSTHNLKVSIMNSIGQIVYVVKENGIYESGEHTELINIENLSAGSYYAVVETDMFRIVKPFIHN